MSRVDAYVDLKVVLLSESHVPVDFYIKKKERKKTKTKTKTKTKKKQKKTKKKHLARKPNDLNILSIRSFTDLICLLS